MYLCAHLLTKIAAHRVYTKNIINNHIYTCIYKQVKKQTVFKPVHYISKLVNNQYI